MADDDDERRDWHGKGEPKPRLPYYFRTRKRLRGLDEFEDPDWKGRTQFADDEPVTFVGVAREAFQWLVFFAILLAVGGGMWRAYENRTCAEIIGGLKIGWC